MTQFRPSFCESRHCARTVRSSTLARGARRTPAVGHEFSAVILTVTVTVMVIVTVRLGAWDAGSPLPAPIRVPLRAGSSSERSAMPHASLCIFHPSPGYFSECVPQRCVTSPGNEATAFESGRRSQKNTPNPVAGSGSYIGNRERGHVRIIGWFLFFIHKRWGIRILNEVPKAPRGRRAEHLY